MERRQTESDIAVVKTAPLVQGGCDKSVTPQCIKSKCQCCKTLGTKAENETRSDTYNSRPISNTQPDDRITRK